MATVLKAQRSAEKWFSFMKNIINNVKAVRTNEIGNLIQKYAKFIKTTHIIRVVYFFDY